MEKVHVYILCRVLSTGGEKIPPPPKKKILPIRKVSIEAVTPVSFAKNLSVIPQLLGPQNCLRMPQNHSQKAQNVKTF